MDGSDDQEIEKPMVQVFNKGFFETIKGKLVLATGAGVMLFVILVVSLNYFDVISSSRLAFLPKKATDLSSTPVKITLIPENYGFKAGELTLNCPVESAFCNSQKLIQLDTKDAVAYKAASGSAVLNLSDIATLENIAVLENKQTGRKYFYESSISKDGKSCYTITYTLPDDAIFQNILDLEFLNNKGAFANLGSQTFKIEGSELNVLIQVRNTPIDPGVPCSLLKKSPEFFQNF